MTSGPVWRTPQGSFYEIEQTLELLKTRRDVGGNVLGNLNVVIRPLRTPSTYACVSYRSRPRSYTTLFTHPRRDDKRQATRGDLVGDDRGRFITGKGRRQALDRHRRPGARGPGRLHRLVPRPGAQKPCPGGRRSTSTW